MPGRGELHRVLQVDDSVDRRCLGRRRGNERLNLLAVALLSGGGVEVGPRELQLDRGIGVPDVGLVLLTDLVEQLVDLGTEFATTSQGIIRG